MEIKNFEAVLSPMIGDKKIVSHTTKNLMAPGENYGSTMLAVDVKLEGGEELHLVAKMCPPTEFIKKVFNIPVTFKKEVDFYTKIIPTLQAFQKERGSSKIMNFFPKYYGSRLSLNPDAHEVDDNACLLLENIKIKGYDIADRIEGFNLETAEFLIKDLAMFHAVPIAFKLTHPQRFKEIIALLPRHFDHDRFNSSLAEGVCEHILEAAKKCKECVQYLDQIKTQFLGQHEYYINLNARDNEPFATIVHNDLWVNNTMLKFDDNRKPIANAMVDFQVVYYASFAHDLLFFIYSSLSVDIITQHYQRLIDLHYNTFIDVLRDLKVNTEQFTYELFLKEIENAAKDLQFFHIALMMKPIFIDKSKAKKLSEINEDGMLDPESLHEKYYPKLWHTILDFAANGWLSTKQN